MPIISSVIKGIFGDKSVKDRKLIWPIVEDINEFQKSLGSISDEDLKGQYTSLKIELSNLIKTKRYLIHTISLIIPYTAGIIFIDAFSNYYHIRKCETFDESSLSLCLIINAHYILMINMVKLNILICFLKT